MQAEMLPKIDRWADENCDNMVRSLIEMVKIRSVFSEKTEQYPFGKECAAILDKVVEIAGEHGIAVQNHDYYYGTAELQGESDKSIGFFSHLDIVPEGEGWASDPFLPEIRDGHLFGRGVMDNKSSAVATLYMMKCFRELNVPLKNTLRLFFGCDEESEMDDIKRFAKSDLVPTLSIIPDAKFAVCFGEKGIYRATLVSEPLTGNLVEINGGTAINTVSDRVTAVLSGVDVAAVAALAVGDENLIVEPCDSNVRITAKGKAAHASFPELGDCAVTRLAKFLSEKSLLTGSAATAIQFIVDSFTDYYGSGFDIAMEDEYSGKLTDICGIIKMQDGRITLISDIRYPVTGKGQVITDGLRAACGKSVYALERIDDDAPIFIDPTHPVVVALTEDFNAYMGQEQEPFVMGSATYARRLPNAFTYGHIYNEMQLPGAPNKAWPHMPDECIRIENLPAMIKIYARAILRLEALI